MLFFLPVVLHAEKAMPELLLEGTHVGTIYFSINSSGISAENLKRLAQITRDLNQYQDVLLENEKKIKVIGFADTPGKTEHNLKLGIHRAENTAQTLKKLGVPLEHIVILSFGESVFSEENAKFRKAEIWISGISAPVRAKNYELVIPLFFLFLVSIVLIFFVIFYSKRPERF